MSVWRRVRREAEARSAEWSALAATHNAAVKDLYEEEQQLIVSGADAWELALLYYRRLMDLAWTNRVSLDLRIDVNGITG